MCMMVLPTFVLKDLVFQPVQNQNILKTFTRRHYWNDPIPECILAREMQICYMSIATVTDYDVWYENPVSSREILEVLTKNANRTKELLTALIPSIPETRNKCKCKQHYKMLWFNLDFWLQDHENYFSFDKFSLQH